MQPHFKKIRSMLALAAIAVPLLYFATFICFAASLELWSLIPFLLAITLVLCFPLWAIGKPSPAKKASGAARILGNIPLFFIMLWLLHMPEFGKFMDRALGGALWDWKPITAALIWTALSIHSNWRTLTSLTDEMIFRYYDKPREKMAE